VAERAKGITGAELKVMKVLWRLGAGTVRDVKDALTKRGADPAYTTVMTLMGQLAAKGFLEVDREREPFVYRPAVARERVLRERVQEFLNAVFDGQAGELVLRLVEDADLSPDELREIEAKIASREKRPAKRGKRATS
jgi:BlaI family transcriptional regulator, penicillinase repressor